MLRKGKLFIALLAAAVLFIACNGYEHETIPNVKVNFTIYPDSPNYVNLNYIGGHEYVTGGVQGIIIYRVDQSSFVAYDRACPYDWEEHDSWLWVDESGILIRDSLCGSVFNILDGSVISGPSKYNLKFYKTMYDGRRLRVYN